LKASAWDIHGDVFSDHAFIFQEAEELRQRSELRMPRLIRVALIETPGEIILDVLARDG